MDKYFNDYRAVASDAKSTVTDSVSQIPGALNPDLSEGSLTGLVGVENPDVDFTSPTEVVTSAASTAAETVTNIVESITHTDDAGASSSTGTTGNTSGSRVTSASSGSASTTPADASANANYSAPENTTTPLITVSK